MTICFLTVRAVIIVTVAVLASRQFVILSCTATSPGAFGSIPEEELDTLVVNDVHTTEHSLPVQDSLAEIAHVSASEVSLSEQTSSELISHESTLSQTDLVYPLRNDKSIPWSQQVHRLWLDPSTNDRPLAQLMVTNFGWNSNDTELGLRLIRTIRSRELLQGVLNHPWFHPTAWEDYDSGQMAMDNRTRFYVFLDIETCFEKNYPIYADGGLNTCSDREYGRGMFRGRRRHCNALAQVLKSPVMRNPAGATVIYFDCFGNGPQQCWPPEVTPTHQVAMASISAHTRQHLSRFDMGLPPPAPRSVELTLEQETNMDTCTESSRPYLLTFAGTISRELRHRLFDLHNGKDVIMVAKPRGVNMPEYIGDKNYSYTELMVQSKFTAVPRGDNLFSYRFTEAMSAGAIPVVYSDEWVLPFRKRLVDWDSCCAVIIPESQVKSTLRILNNITEERRCQMRKNVLEVYRRYMNTGEAVIAGIIEALELEATDTARNSSWNVS